MRGGIGSDSNTSIPAPPMRFAARAATSASSSTTPPRAVLTTNVVVFIDASSFAPMIPRVSWLSGVCTVTASIPGNAARRSSTTAQPAASITPGST